MLINNITSDLMHISPIFVGLLLIFRRSSSQTYCDMEAPVPYGSLDNTTYKRSILHVVVNKCQHMVRLNSGLRFLTMDLYTNLAMTSLLYNRTNKELKTSCPRNY